jgi:hypothetical protein
MNDRVAHECSREIGARAAGPRDRTSRPLARRVLLPRPHGQPTRRNDMSETNEPTDTTIAACQSDDFMIEDLEERFVQEGKLECACSSCTCECCSCCFYIF